MRDTAKPGRQGRVRSGGLESLRRLVDRFDEEHGRVLQEGQCLEQKGEGGSGKQKAVKRNAQSRVLSFA